MPRVLSAAIAAAAAGEQAALATVIATSGSTPRHAGARMLVHADGRIVGTIGGGKIELEVVTRARAVAAGAAPAERLARHLTRELAMCCGGGMTLWLEPVDGGRAATWRAALAERAARRAASVAIHDDAGVEVFREALVPPPRAILFGAGHVAQALAPLCAAVGFEITVCDEDETYLTAARFPAALRLVPTFDVADARAALGAFGADDHAVILTRDHAIDQALVEALLVEPTLGTLGLIGSRGKVARFRARLEARGTLDLAAWARLHAPVGLDIGAETPEEIAVAIVAELIAHRRGRWRRGIDTAAGPARMPL